MALKVVLKRRRVLACISAGCAVLAGGFFAVQAVLAPAQAVKVSSLTTTITVNPSVGITFSPAPPDAAPALTGAQAWTLYANAQGWPTTVPSNVTVQLGLVTVPVGPAGSPGTGNLVTVNNVAYMAYDQLAYGYSSQTSCPAHYDAAGAASPPPTPTSSPGACIDWSFVDAKTGTQIVETWQEVG